MNMAVARNLGWALAVVLVAPGASAADKDKYDIGERVPGFSLKVVNDKDAGTNFVGLDDFVGDSPEAPKKAVLMSFFATYCKPCIKEMPFLAALHETYKDKGLQILSITIDKEADKVEEAKALASKAGIKFPLLTDRFNIVARRYFIEKLPCVYILDAQGKVQLVKVGYDDDVSRFLLDAVRGQLGEPTSDPVPATLASFVPDAPAPVATAPEEAPAAAEDEGAAEEDDKGKKKKRKKRKKKKRKGR